MVKVSQKIRDERYTKENITIYLKKFDIDFVDLYLHQDNTHGKILKIKCKRGHESELRLHKIYNNKKICKHCRIKSVSEEICRYHFEQLFGDKFISIFAPWIRSSITNKMLELDGYCSNLNLAFEHQGVQHYEKDYYLNNAIDGKFETIQFNDKIKAKRCLEQNIKLICIPDITKYLKIENLQQFILDECDKQNIFVPNRNLKINIDDVKVQTWAESQFDIIKDIVETKDGKILDDFFKDKTTLMKIECKHGHKFKKRAENLRRGSWCLDCLTASKYDIKDFHKYAKSKGGKCLDTEFVSYLKDVTFECKEGHQWKLNGRGVFETKSWCRICMDKAGGYKQRIITLTEVKNILNKNCFTYNKNIKYDKKVQNKVAFEVTCINNHVTTKKARDVLKITKPTHCKDCYIKMRPIKTKYNIDELEQNLKDVGMCLNDDRNNYLKPMRREHRIKVKCLLHNHESEKTIRLIMSGCSCKHCCNSDRITM